MLSSDEININYRELPEPSIYERFGNQMRYENLVAMAPYFMGITLFIIMLFVVWYYKYGSVNKSATSMNEYNNWIMDSLKNGSGWVGVSLKKGGGTVGIVNDIHRPEYKVTGLETKYGGLLSQGVTFNYNGVDLDGFGLNFRIFQGGSTELNRGEVI